jgi:hypothetical protein
VVSLNVGAVKVKVKVPAVPVIARSVNLAMPEEVSTFLVPLSVPEPDEIDARIVAVYEVTVLPPESIMRITGCVPRVDSLAAPVG